MQQEISNVLTLSMTASIFTLSYAGLMVVMPATSLLFIPNTVLAGIIATSAAITDGFIYGKNINQGITRCFKQLTSLHEDGLIKILLFGSIFAASIGAGTAVASSAFEFLMTIYPNIIFSTSAISTAFAGLFALSAISSVSFFFVLYNIADDLYQCKDKHLQNWYNKLSSPELSYNYLLLSVTATLGAAYSFFTFFAWQNKVFEVAKYLPFMNPVINNIFVLSYTFWESISTFGNAFTAIEELTEDDSLHENHKENNLTKTENNSESWYQSFYNNKIKPIVFWTHTIGEACVINTPGAMAFLSTAVSFTIKNLAEFNQFLGGEHHHHHNHENSENKETCAFGHSHDNNPIDYLLCEVPQRIFKKRLIFNS